MDFGDLFQEKNKSFCRWLGVIFTAIPLLFGLSQPIMPSEGISGYFGEWFTIGLTLMMIFGILFLIVGYSKRTGSNGNGD